MESVVFGAGYVGLVQAAGLSAAGNHITLADISRERIELLKEGGCPIYEPQLPELLQKGVTSKTLRFALVGSEDYLNAVKGAEIFFIAVQTPQGKDGRVDLDFVFAVVDQLCQLPFDLNDRIVVTKSTVPVGTADLIEERFRKAGKNPIVVSNPEFLKQGSAVQDFLKPERVIVGTNHPKAKELLGFMYQPFMMKRERIIFMSRRSAELVKYACNSFLATKISFINEIAALAERTGADIREIRRGMISDSRIGDQFLFPGVGFGGSCFPKDTIGLIAQGDAQEVPMPVTNATVQVNRRQKQWCFNQLRGILQDFKGKRIALWGLSFKPNTDDLREAPSLDLIESVVQAGAKVYAYDPVARESAHRWIDTHISSGTVILCADPYQAAKDADALVVMTEWLEFRSPHFSELKRLMKRALIIDGRNLYGPEIAKRYNFEYKGVGIGV